MKASDFKAVWGQSPFTPCQIHADGRTVLVDHPEQVFLTPDKATVIVAPREGGIKSLAVDLISDLTVPPRKRRPRPSAAA